MAPAKPASSAARPRPKTAPSAAAKRPRLAAATGAGDKRGRATTTNNNNNKRVRGPVSEKDKELARKRSLENRAKANAEAARDARQELIVRMNKLWNELREKDLDGGKRKAIAAELAACLKGKIVSFAQRPDTSRVIQTVFKFGDAAVREPILSELAGNMMALAKGKHSSFLIIALLRHGAQAERSKIASELRNYVRTLGTHANGARVVNFCLSGKAGAGNDDHDGTDDIVTPSERKRFYESFYGPEISLLLNAGLNNSSSEPNTSFELAHYLPRADEGEGEGEDATGETSAKQKKRSQLLQPVKKAVLKIAEKGLLRFPFAQVLLWQVVKNGSREDIAEMIPSVSEASLALVGTWEGAQAVARCIVAGDAKERKKIVKEWKGHVTDLCAHRFGWYPVCRALDSIDDTVFLDKAIVEELCADEYMVKNLMCQEDGFGRKAFLRVLAPAERMASYFEHFDERFARDALSTSKKDDALRSAEVVAKMKPALLHAIATSAADLLANSRATDVVRETLFRVRALSRGGDTNADEAADVAKAVSALAEASADLMEDARAHATMKRIIRDETTAAVAGDDSFALALARTLRGKIAELAKVNRPAFVLEALLLNPASGKLVAEQLEGVDLSSSNNKGCEALAKHLAVAAAASSGAGAGASKRSKQPPAVVEPESTSKPKTAAKRKAESSTKKTKV